MLLCALGHNLWKTWKCLNLSYLWPFKQKWQSKKSAKLCSFLIIDVIFEVHTSMYEDASMKDIPNMTKMWAKTEQSWSLTLELVCQCRGSAGLPAGMSGCDQYGPPPTCCS